MKEKLIFCGFETKRETHLSFTENHEKGEQ